MKNVVFCDIQAQFVPHRKHCVSVTDPSRLLLLRFGVFKAVTMKNTVFWDIRTQFVPHMKHFSATEPSRLMLCKTGGFHGGDYEECRLLGCYAV
jgi:hypothetical protein